MQARGIEGVVAQGETVQSVQMLRLKVMVDVDLEWALSRLRGRTKIIGGDICGAFSPPSYARWKQRFAAEFDHPKVQLPAADQIYKTNSAALSNLWPALTQ